MLLNRLTCLLVIWSCDFWDQFSWLTGSLAGLVPTDLVTTGDLVTMPVVWRSAFHHAVPPCESREKQIWETHWDNFAVVQNHIEERGQPLCKMAMGTHGNSGCKCVNWSIQISFVSVRRSFDSLRSSELWYVCFVIFGFEESGQMTAVCYGMSLGELEAAL